MQSLKDKAISGLFWSFLQKIGSNGITFLVMILLARLLAPEDFGLIGMLMIFILVSQALVDGGFNLALIQKKEVDEEEYSAVFYLNLLISILLYTILFFSAPFVADFYEQQVLTVLLRTLSLVFVINAFSFVQEARLMKEIRFKTLMAINIPSTIIGGLISIIMAFNEFGVWSLVALQITTRLAFAIQIWIYAKWKPLLSFKIRRTTALFSFGSKLLIARLIGTIYNNIFLVLIGKFFPVSSVGYYQNAFNVATTPANTFSSVLSRVTFSAFSSIQDEDQRLKIGYKKVMQQACFWIFPAYALAAVLAEPLFRFVFTEKWLPAVPYFQWLCVIGIFIPLNTYNLNIVNVKGRSDVFLKLQLVRRGIVTIGLIFAIPYGITALLALQAAGAVFTFFLFSYFSGRFINYNLSEQLKDILPIILLSTVIGIFIFAIDNLISGISDFLRLIIGFFTGGIIYLVTAKLLAFPSFVEMQFIFQNKFLNKFLISK